MSPLGIVGFSAVALVVVGWLVISFTAPSPRRTILEWLSSCALYVALLSLFVNLVLRAQQDGHNVAAVALGFLVALFGTGLLIAIVQLLKSFGGPRQSGVSATH